MRVLLIDAGTTNVRRRRADDDSLRAADLMNCDLIRAAQRISLMEKREVFLLGYKVFINHFRTSQWLR